MLNRPGICKNLGWFGAVLLFSVIYASPARPDFDLRRWEYYAEIKAPKDTPNQYVIAAVTKGVYGKSKLDLSDIRIVLGESQEIPYKLIVDEGHVEEKAQTANILNKSVVEGKYNSFVLDLSKPGIVSNRVVIQTSSKNFMRRVEIEGGNDGQNWATIRKDGNIFDFSRDYYYQMTSISYPDSDYRYIRVKIWNYDQKPIEVTGASILRREVKPKKEILFYEGKGDAAQNSDERSTDILVDMQSEGIPGERLVITSSDINYNRWVEVAGSNDRKRWIDLGSGQILKYDTPKFKSEESSIEYSPEGYRYIRVRIRNYDNPPLAQTNLKVYGIRRQVFFSYATGGNYRLYFGNPDAQRPIYDIEDAFKYIPSDKAAKLKLGPAVKNPKFVRPIGTRHWMEENPWILWVVLIGAVLILTVFIIRLVIQTKETPPGASE